MRRRIELIPALPAASILPPTNPRTWTQAQRTFGGRLAGKVGTGFPVRQPTCQLVSVRVPCGSLQGGPKADRWPDEEPGVPRRTGETRRGTVDVTGNGVIPTNPSPRCRHKPKIPDAWGDDRFIYKNKIVRSVHRPMPSISSQSEVIAVGGFRMRQKKERPPHQPAGHPLPGGARVKLAEARR